MSTRATAKKAAPAKSAARGRAASPEAAAKRRSSVNQITLRSREVRDLLNGEGASVPNPTLRLSHRPIVGLDLEEWRGMVKLSKFDASAALGFRSATMYNRECSRKVLAVSIEILLRLYMEKPESYPWTQLTFKELFSQMYDRYIDAFAFDPDLQSRARGTLEARFTVFFGRSPTRGYTWLRGEEGDSYATVNRIMQKLTQWENPGETFERIASQTLRLRGVDIDELFPIPTPENPPMRGKPGRKPTLASLQTRVERAKRQAQKAAARAEAQTKKAQELGSLASQKGKKADKAAKVTKTAERRAVEAAQQAATTAAEARAQAEEKAKVFADLQRRLAEAEKSAKTGR